MYEFLTGITSAALVGLAMAGLCHAASAGGYCSNYCNSTEGVQVKYPFRLMSDAVSGQCYTNYSNLEFQCINLILYLNITNEPYMYRVDAIDYLNQTLTLEPDRSNEVCRQFDPTDFGGLTMARNSTLLLDCASSINPQNCISYDKNIYSNPCNHSASAVAANTSVETRFCCPFTLLDYANSSSYRNNCHLFQQNILSKLPTGNTLPANSSNTVELQYHSNRSLSFVSPASASAPAPALAPAPASAIAPAPRKTILKKVAVALSSTISLLFGIILFGFLLSWLRNRNSCRREFQLELAKQHVQPFLYDYQQIRGATNDFHLDNKLGEGGFGVVYKGTLRDGRQMAFKKLSKCDQGVTDFLNEVVLITGIKHRNLVKLEGCCVKGKEKILVYEYVANKNLAEALWGIDCLTQHSTLRWQTRYNICVDIAQGLAFLHEHTQPRIIHRDIKAPNILLDETFNAKIADFGTARLFNDEATHLTTMHIAGTLGYMAPEYALRGQLTEKADAYSYGILVLEVVSGRRNVDPGLSSEEMYLVDWAWNRYTEEKVMELLDKKLDMMSVPFVELHRVITVALQCLQMSPAKRPSMSSVVAMLLGERAMENATPDQDLIVDQHAHISASMQESNTTTTSGDLISAHMETSLLKCSHVYDYSIMTAR